MDYFLDNGKFPLFPGETLKMVLLCLKYDWNHFEKENMCNTLQKIMMRTL